MIDHPPIVNVGEYERIACGILGGLLVATALPELKLVRLAEGAAFLYRAWSGNCKGYELLGLSSCPVRGGHRP